MHNDDPIGSKLEDLGKFPIDFKKSVFPVFDLFIDLIDKIIERFFIKRSSFDDRLPTSRMSFLFEDRSAFFDVQRHRRLIEELIEETVSDDFFHGDIS